MFIYAPKPMILALNVSICVTVCTFRMWCRTVWWVVADTLPLSFYPEDGHSRFHHNIGKYLHCINVEGFSNALANIVAAMFSVNDFATDFGSSYSALMLRSVSELRWWLDEQRRSMLVSIPLCTSTNRRCLTQELELPISSSLVQSPHIVRMARQNLKIATRPTHKKIETTVT
jgi:hypothetical protein